MPAVNIPLTTSLKIEEFAAGAISIAVSQVVNGVFDQRADGAWYVTQRPAVNITTDASATVSLTRGRGVYYWNAASAVYFVNDYQVYKSDYSTGVNEAGQAVTLTGTGTVATATATAHGYANGDFVTISVATDTNYNGTFAITNVTANTFDYASTGTGADSGTAIRSLGPGGVGRVYFHEVGNYLVIIDSDNNTGWYIAVGSSTTLVQITDADFPSTLAMGGAVLNGRLYVMDADGVIYGSDLEDPTAWNALNFISAEIAQDGGVCLGVKDEQIVALGERTIEYFYDASNPTGSPLAPRLDVSYQIGMADEHTLWNESGILLFVGKTRSGEIGAYMTIGMEPQKISTTDIDSMLTSAVTTDGQSLVGCGFSIGGRILYLITIYNTVGGDVVPVTTLVYNAKNSTWTTWELMHTGIDDCPVISWTESTATRVGEGILSNGDLVTLADDFNPQDLTLASGVFVSGVYEPGVFSETGASGDPIEMIVISGPEDFGTRNRKLCHRIRANCTKTKHSQTLTIYFSNDDNDSYGTGRALDLNRPGDSLRRCGNFRQRNHKIMYSGNEQIELEGLEADIEWCGT